MTHDRSFRMPGLVRTSALALPLFLLSAAAAHAQQSPASETLAAPDEQHDEDNGKAIVVVGRMVAGSKDPIYAPVVLQGEALARDLRPQIGQMLEKLPGVSASGFAPGASRPVLRGFDGPRVQVLLDGLGALDASSVSADHAVSLDTLTIDRIDVLHGPQVLLYASDPSGGAVNAMDRRIPRRVPDSVATFDGLASYGKAADAVSAGGAGDVRLADRLVAHVDASWSRSEDLRVGGAILSPGLRGQVLQQAAALLAADDLDGAASLRAQAAQSGRLRNSGAKQWTLGGGIAFIDDGGEIGVSASRLSSDYGIPPRPAVGSDAPVSIALRQTRIDLRAAVRPGGVFEKLELRGAFGDYRHSEVEDGIVGTTFANKAIEARFEATQARRGIWSGVSGIQYGTRRLDVSGAESLLPDSTTDRFAAFTLQRLTFGAADLEVAGRYEHTAVHVRPDGMSRSFAQFSGTAGAALHITEALTGSVSLSRGERAPSSEELFIDGIHDATQSYERGDPTFGTERSTGIEAGLRYQSPGLAAAITAYATDFADFITAVPTGEEIEGFPVFQFLQHKARFRGFEAEASVRLAEWGSRVLTIDGGADYTRATLAGMGPVPRIPPLRLRGGIELAGDAVSLRGDVEWNARQARVANNEYPTAAFTLVNLSGTWRPMGKGGPLSLIVSADNLLDVSGRRAASETRDFVPISGRDIRVTAKVSF